MVDLLRTAIDLAYKLHAGQVRKGLPLPAITHPCDVVRRLVHWEIEDYTVLAAAILHDTLEDCNVTPYTLSQAVGPQVTAIVESLTYDGPAGNAEAKRAWIDSIGRKSPEALIIKLADRICNTEDFLLTDPAYARTYLEKANSLYIAVYERQEEIKQRFGNAGIEAITEADDLDERMP